jgi:hypothetical protein
VTTVAGRTEILVIPHPGVVTISRGLTVSVAQNALKGRVVVGVDMTVGARKPAMSAGTDREQIIVVPSAGCPVRCRVTGDASCRETGRCMRRIARCIICGLVTGIAVSWRSAAVSVGMARSTGDRRMEPGQREARGCVVKRRRRPGGGTVARDTRMADAVGDVIQRAGTCKISLVTSVAVGRRSATVSGSVARGTGDRRMEPGEREACRCMIKRRRCPAGC